MANITLVTTDQHEPALSPLVDDENTGSTFSARIATEADPTTPIGYISAYDSGAYGSQPQRPKQAGQWNLHRLLADHPDIGDQINMLSGDDQADPLSLEFTADDDSLVLMAWRNTPTETVWADLGVFFGEPIGPHQPPEEP